jgi:glucose/arabinose dehydrogenase
VSVLAEAEAGTAERVATGLHFPTSLAFDDDGRAYVAESGLPFGGAPAGGRVLRLRDDGCAEVVAEGLRAPLNGLVWHEGGFYLSEGGFPGRISRLTVDGARTTVIDGLPGRGNYHTNTVAVGPDGMLYWGQGAMTNLGVVGLDAHDLAWLKQLPHPHDVPGMDVVLTGYAAATADPLEGADARAVTGAFAPFGTAAPGGTRIPAGLPCTAAVLRCRPDGSGLELVAWGIRNAFGLGFLPDGRLIATDQGSDDRGSRPIAGVPELVFEVKKDAWYGWPDFVGGVPVTDPRFAPRRGPAPTFLLANHAELPPPERPLMALPVNSSACKFSVLPADGPWPGHLLVALFGDEVPMTAPSGPRSGRTVVRVDTQAWTAHPVDGVPPLHRPIDVRIHPRTGEAWVLDFGEFELAPGGGMHARPGSGAVWRLRAE